MARTAPLFVGTNGYIAALDPDNGQELWRTKLPKCGGIGEPVAMVIKGGHLFAGANGKVWCLDKSDGRVCWTNGLPGTGYHTVLLALEDADAGTGLDATLTAAHRRRQQQRAAAASASAAS
jgi:outer membrane protein assembly factor BamB